MFFAWFLKYSSFFVTGIISFVVAYLVDRFITRRPRLIYYTSHQQYVVLPPAPNQPPPAQPPNPIGTFTLFLWNQGKAPAKDVYVGHFWLPAFNVYPDIPRETIDTPGGGKAIRFPTVPPKVLISVSYLHFLAAPIAQIVSYVGSEEGAAQWIPVMLQRVWPNWFNYSAGAVLFLGLWTLLTLLINFIVLLSRVFYR
jgi:hypothetical protein